MACAAACRQSSRIAGGIIRTRRASGRDFTTSCQRWAASNFVMPAMSPTMTEGNIATWKVKEGDSFSTGDVLLEIETDKAQMDVEAQDDGILAKITQQDGAKSIKVGSRIAVLAEPGDDISSLEIPEEDVPEKPTESKASSPPKESSSSSDKAQESSEEKPEAPQKPAESHAPSSSSDAKPQKYPLYPSVQHLLHTSDIPLSDADKIPATGPSGRLLKGDVLAYLGKIEKSYSSDLSKRISKLGHLDLSNIKPAKKEPKQEKQASKLPEQPELPTEVAVPISLAAVFATQRRIQDSLGLTLPLSTFIARASEIANEDLPKAKGESPSSDELFDAVLGLHSARRTTSRGHYIPRITALPPPNSTLSLPRQPAKQPDIIDILTGSRAKATQPPPSTTSRIPGAMGVGGAENVFSVSVKKGEETRAQVYLERVKSVLEVEPGRCVL